MTDDARLLLDYAKRGDVKSLSSLVVRHSKWLAAYLRGSTSSEADAEDAVQEVWVRVIRSCGSYRGGSVRAYLARIARSVAIDRFRRGRPMVSVDATDGEGAVLAETLADGAPAPNAAFESRATSEDVRRAVRALPENQREVLLMRIEAELSFKEIGKIHSKTESWARVTYHRARLMLKEGYSNEI